MLSLPIVARELVVAARSPAFRRIRWWSALSFALLTLTVLYGVKNPSDAGTSCFTAQKLLVFLTCALSGVFFTADTLSREKREGTIGLLFLTDLRVRDVVLGKFAAVALTSGYTLLGLLPMIGLPLLLGGVSGDEFFRMALVEINMLFFSMAAGMFFSACSREADRAMMSCLIFLLIIVLGVPALAWVAAKAGAPVFTAPSPTPTQIAGSPGFVKAGGPVLLAPRHSGIVVSTIEQTMRLVGRLSPGQAFELVSDAGQNSAAAAMFWQSLAGSHLLGWVGLGMAGFVLRRNWMKEGESSGIHQWLWRKLAIQRKPRLLKQENPIDWLLSGPSALTRAAWWLIFLWFGVEIVTCILLDRYTRLSFFAGEYLLVDFLFIAIAAFASCRFFVESRRSGALELILCTPITQGEILEGHFLAIVGALWAPCFAFTGLGIISCVFLLKPEYSMWCMINFVVLILWILAINKFAMFLSLKMRNPQWAPAMAMLVIGIGPWIAALVTNCMLLPVLIGLYWWVGRGLKNDWRIYQVPSGGAARAKG